MKINLYYEEAGKGEVLILLHGNGEDHSYFTHQIDYFKHGYHVIAIDTRGHGKSPRGEAPFTIRQFVKDLYAFFEEHDIEKAHLLGFSDGGNIATLFAMMYPNRVDKLILNGSNLSAKGVRPIYQVPITLMYWVMCPLAFFNKKAKHMAELFRLMVHDPNIDPHELSAIKAKTLVIAGTRDMIKKKHTQLICDLIPDARLSILEGDHFVAHKNPSIFNKVVKSFL